jgi:hypothetical protein
MTLTAHTLFLILAIIFALLAAFGATITPRVQWLGLAVAALAAAFLFG